jgi:flavin-dependent dehydrogenase
LIAEKCAFPRFHIGESTLPGSWSVFWKLGVADKLDQSGQQRKLGAVFNLYGEREYHYGLAKDVLEFLPENRGRLYSFNVLRSQFDQMLLDNAREKGVEVIQPASVEQVRFEGNRATGVIIRDQSGNRFAVDAKVVVDCSGRDCFIARQFRLRNPDPKLNKVAYFTHYRGAYHHPGEFVTVWLLAFEGGWVWYIEMMEDLVSVGIVADPTYVKTRGRRDLATFFHDTLGKVPYIHEWIAGAERVTDLHAISALSYQVDRFVGDGWILAGDAAGFVDPMFSSGIHLALKSGDLASQAIAAAFQIGDFSAESLAAYEREYRVQMNAIFPMIYRWYDAISDKERSLTLFDHAMRFTALRRQVTASLIGALELVAHDPSIRFMASRPTPETSS